MQGYLVQLGNDQLGSGDVIVGPTIGFNVDSNLGTGAWTWTGVYSNGTTYTGVNDSGTYYLGTDGNVYFVPDTWQVAEVISATATSAPSVDYREFGTNGDDTDLSAGAEDDVLYGGRSTSETNTRKDTIDAGAGNDTVFAGSGKDTVIGRGGNDTIFAGNGNDVIWGDNDSSITSEAEILDWSAQGASGTDLTDGLTQDTGTMSVTINANDDGGNTAYEVGGNTQYIEAGVDPFSTTSSLFITGGAGPNITTSFVFNANAGTGMQDEVSNVSFRINDIDIAGWTDVVTVNAYDLDGNLVPVSITLGGSDTISGNTITGANGTDDPDDETGSALINIAGPVHSIEVIYANGGTVGQALWLTNMHFDTIVDPDGADSISGGDGADLIYGGGNNDAISGDDDNDSIFGGAGDDTASGDSGDDTVSGDAGNDTLTGGIGNDTLFGGDDDDSLYGGTGNDDINGDDGNDIASGGDGNDTVSGGAGSDSLNGDAGDDVVYGGADNDTITGADGNDSLFGGTGDDQFNISDDHDQDTITGGEDAGDGDIDTVSFSNTTSTQGIDVTYTANEAGTYDYDGTAGTGSFAEIERVETTAFDDTIDGTAAPGGITVDAGAGDDSIIGGAGADSIDAGTGADTIDGGAGDDVIDLGGPDGDPDLLVFSDGDGTDTVSNFDAPIDNGDGTFTGIDMLDVSDLTDLGGDPVNTHDVLVGGPVGGPTTLTFPNGEQIILQGITPDQLDNPYALNAIGIPLADGTVSGTAGDDLIDGAYLGDPDGDIVDNDDAILPGDTANDDLIEANGGNDSVLAGDGDDEIYGGTGNDSIDGGVDDDTIFGEAGDDTAVVTANFGDDTFTGGETGETTGDKIDATALAANTTVVFSGAEQGTLTQGTNSIDFVEVERIETGSGDDNIFGGTGNDSVDTGAGDDTVYIADNFGNDTFNAGEVDDATGDVLDGAALTEDVTVTFSGPEAGTIDNGTDSIDFAEFEELATGAGDDTINSGAGNDTVETNAGDDTFVITDGFGNDTFEAGEGGETTGDTLDGSALTVDADVNLSGPEAGTLDAGSDTVDFADVENIVTGSGDDTVVGGAGDENVFTGAGNDTVSGGEGSDTFDTGAGDDTITFAEGDSISSGSGDDTFTLEDLGEASNGAINIDGGDEDSATGDTLALGDLADLSTLVATDDGTGSLSGSVTLDDGTLLTFTDIETVICFTPGTLIATTQGARDIATLKVGDPVITRDHGIQPIRWIERRTVQAQDNFAPIRIRPGVLSGQQEDLLVSPQHRMLFQGYRAELLFGETEVLVAAKHLIDGQAVTEEVGGTVTYIHMMFDQHEVVYANGAASESFHPGSVGLTGITEAAREELFTLFPELRSDPTHYGQTARRCLKQHETDLLKL